MRALWLAIPTALGCAQVIGADFDVERRPGCVRALPPPPPEVRDAGSGVSFVVATYSIDLGEGRDVNGRPARLSIGYDRDGVCTSLGGKPRCAPPAWATSAPVVDGDGGRDNGVGAMLATQVENFGAQVIVSSEISDEIRTGVIAPLILLSVSGYNGLADDDEVDVKSYLPALGGRATAPKWDGSDSFPIASETTARRAYVTRYRFVAEFATPLGVRLRNAPMVVDESVVSGLLTPVPGSNPRRWELRDGVFAGRASERELFRATAGISSQLLGSAICRDNPNYRRVKKFFCSFVDLSSGGGRCDSLSMGIGFDTRSCTIGPLDPVAEPKLCPSTAGDPSTDDCSEAAP